MAEVYTLPSASQPQIELVAIFEALGQYHATHPQPMTLEVAQQALEDQLGLTPEHASALLESFACCTNYLGADLHHDQDALEEEDHALEASRQAFLPLFQVRLQQRLAHFDHLWKGQATCPECDQPLRARAFRTRTRLSRLGPVSLTRRWSSCPTHGGLAVADAILLLPDDDFTACLHEVLTHLSAVLPEQKAIQMLEQLSRLQVSKHAAQRLTRQRGQQLHEHLEARAAHLLPFEPSGLPREVAPPDDAPERAPEVACLALDGVLPMTRHEIAREPVEPGARGGKGRRYELAGREVKNAVLFGAQARAEPMPSRGCLLDKRYVSRLGDWESFARWVWAEMRHQGFERSCRLLIYGDGAEWIRSLAQWLPCPVELVLDLYHVAKKVWEVSRVLWVKEPQQRRWARRQLERIEQGQVSRVIQSLKRLETKRAAKASVYQAVQELRGYLESNQDRMDYPGLREQGLPVSSAPVESANYHVTGARLKQQGMRWSEAGAAQMTVLRADVFNSSWRERTRQLMHENLPGAQHFRKAS